VPFDEQVSSGPISQLTVKADSVDKIDNYGSVFQRPKRLGFVDRLSLGRGG
jgi:hypothetical protein